MKKRKKLKKVKLKISKDKNIFNYKYLYSKLLYK